MKELENYEFWRELLHVFSNMVKDQIGQDHYLYLQEQSIQEMRRKGWEAKC
jgi:hypothetical protein